MDPTESARSILETKGWLSQTPQSFREAVLRRTVLQRFQRHEYLYHIADEAGGLWGLVSGSVNVEFGEEKQIPVILHHALPGFWIGHASVITGKPRILGMRTATDSIFLYISRSAFLQIAETDPAAWRWIALLALHQSTALMEKVYDLTIPRAERRVASVLLRLVGRIGAPDVGDGPREPTHLNIGQDALANACNVSRATLAEIMRAFSADGLTRTGYRKISVIDPVRLLRRAEASA